MDFCLLCLFNMPVTFLRVGDRSPVLPRISGGRAMTLARYYALGFIVVCALRFLKYSKISSFVILDNFSLSLSRC